MDSPRLTSNVFGYTIDTMAFLEQWGFSTQSAESAKDGAINFLENCGFCSNPPEKLFRYRSPKYALDEIVKQYIFCPPVTIMPDPFDCLMSSKRMLKKLGLWDDDEDSDDEGFEKIITERMREQISICCFSETPESFSMWDQYAAGHKGVCIEYNSKKLQKLHLTPMKVKYSIKSFKKFNEDAEDVTEYLLGHMLGCTLTKNMDYRHEKEWRLFGVGKNEVSVSDAIDCVYIGARCSRGRNKIIQACRDQGLDYVRMSAKDEEYSFIQKRHDCCHNH